MMRVKRDEVRIGRYIRNEGEDGWTWIPKGVDTTEVGVRNKREPVLGDAFAEEQCSSWHTHKDFQNDIFIV